MDATQIIRTLTTTPYKYTYASKVRDYIKKNDNDDAEKILNELRISLTDPNCREIKRPIKEILNYFSTTTY